MLNMKPEQNLVFSFFHFYYSYNHIWNILLHLDGRVIDVNIINKAEVSEDVIDAIKALYDGKRSSQVICEK